ncbi:MAG: 3'-5' exonuclease [Candidatus Aenigmatarchaeota archaeon]
MTSKNYVILDIETLPIDFDNEEILDYLIEKKFPRGRHPAFSRTFVIGLKSLEETIILRNEDEDRLLKDFWNKIEDMDPDKIITWNGFGFDVPFLKVRSRILGIKPTFVIEENKWKMFSSNHMDCMLLFSGLEEKFNWIRLDIASDILGIEHNRIFNGGEVENLYKKGNVQEIEDHCREDLRMLEEVYKKLRHTISENEGSNLATEKQIKYIMSIANKKGIEVDKEKIEKYSKEEASEWIDENKE